jgi:hypothetical protein
MYYTNSHQTNKEKAAHNSKFVQKRLTVVYVNSSGIYLILYSTTMVLQAMSFLRQAPKRMILYKQL